MNTNKKGDIGLVEPKNKIRNINYASDYEDINICW
jgi:hypothetical protein